MNLPVWLKELRGKFVVQPITSDPRSVKGSLLGYSKEDIFAGAIGGGQANFDESWNDLSSEDRVRLYCYLNQIGHLEELLEAFEMMFGNGDISDKNPIFLDIGCGPFTGGLALCAALKDGGGFTYVGVDQSQTMIDFGNSMITEAIAKNSLDVTVTTQAEISDVQIPDPLSWRPVFIIVSYLLASESLDVEKLVADLDVFLKRTSLGPVTLLYTNAIAASANRSYATFSNSLRQLGFSELINERGSIKIPRKGTDRAMQYALLHRPAQETLKLGEG